MGIGMRFTSTIIYIARAIVGTATRTEYIIEVAIDLCPELIKAVRSGRCICGKEIRRIGGMITHLASCRKASRVLMAIEGVRSVVENEVFERIDSTQGSGSPRWRCRICGVIEKKPADMIRHVRSRHPDVYREILDRVRKVFALDQQ